MKKFILYAIRWQLSTPILWGVLSLFPLLGITDSLVNTIIANLIGASIFFFIDKKIFKEKKL
jgi:hypothetical protein